MPEVLLKVQLSTGRTAPGLLHCFGVGVWGARPFVTRIHGVSPCTTSSLPSPIPRLASPHPYPRSSAHSHFFYGSLHVHTCHHTSPRALPRRHYWGPNVFLDCIRIQVCASPLYGGVSPPNIIRWTITHLIPENTIHTTRRYTYPYPSHSDRSSRDVQLAGTHTTTASGRLRSFNLLTV